MALSGYQSDGQEKSGSNAESSNKAELSSNAKNYLWRYIDDELEALDSLTAIAIDGAKASASPKPASVGQMKPGI